MPLDPGPSRSMPGSDPGLIPADTLRIVGRLGTALAEGDTPAAIAVLDSLRALLTGRGTGTTNATASRKRRHSWS
jgi:hypothetical protein